MILPGYADYVDFKGYLIERCPDCHQTGVFAVFEAKRKLTITFIPTPVNIQHTRVMECKTCGAKFSVPKEWEEGLADRLLTQEQLSARVRELRANGGYLGSPTQRQPAVGDGKRTAYQVLQVDPAADHDVIEAAFKRLALKAHPDRNEGPESAARMRELLAARDILADPAKRRGYDLSLGITRPPGAYAKGPRIRDEGPPPRQRGDDTSPASSRRPDETGNRRDGADGQAPRALPKPGPRPKAIRADEV